MEYGRRSNVATRGTPSRSTSATVSACASDVSARRSDDVDRTARESRNERPGGGRAERPREDVVALGKCHGADDQRLGRSGEPCRR
jgi:hypothetical protein